MNANAHYDVAEARSALDYIAPPLDRDNWLRLLMAAKDAGITEEEARAWSERGENYNAADFSSAWKSIKPGGVTAGTLFYYATDLGWRSSNCANKITQAGRTRIDAGLAAKREKEVEEKARRNANAAEKAKKIWDAARPANDQHPYLVRKGVRSHGLREGCWERTFFPTREVYAIEGALLIPIHDANNEIHTLQAIFPNRDSKLDRDRDYLPGGAKYGNFFMIGKPATFDGVQTIVIGEGYATMASVHEATGLASVAAFDASNLMPVSKIIRKLFPEILIVIFSDRDHENLAQSPGTVKALQAAREIKASIVVPDWTGLNGRDANDIYREDSGKNKLITCVRNAVQSDSSAFGDLTERTGLSKEVPQHKQGIVTAMEAKPSAAMTDEMTEDRLATIFEDIHEHHLRYCHETGRWYVWSGCKWEPDRTLYAFDLARKICNEHAGWLAKFQTARAVSAIERLAKSSRRLAIEQNAFDRNPLLLGTPGGVVDLTTGELKEAVATDYITRNTAIVPAPAGSIPHRWIHFLEEATSNDTEMIRFLQQVAGYVLAGDTREEALFFIYGPGGNGKGVFLNTIIKILGDYSQPAAMDTFTEQRNEKHSTDLAALKGARLVTASETEEGKAWAESRIKQLTGRDPITARFMRCDNFTYIPEFKIIILGNHKPRLKSVDESVRRRFNIIPFTVVPKVKDKLLCNALWQEAPEILRWMIDGCLDWLQCGLIRPDRVKEETDEYFAEQDIFGQWIDECCVRNEQAFTASSVLFKDWERYAEIANEYVGSSKAFSELLQKRGYKRCRNNKVRGFRGLSLNITRPTNEF